MSGIVLDCYNEEGSNARGKAVDTSHLPPLVMSSEWRSKQHHGYKWLNLVAILGGAGSSLETFGVHTATQRRTSDVKRVNCDPACLAMQIFWFKSKCVEPPEKTEDTLEGLCVTSALRMPWDTPRTPRVGGRG